MNAPEFNISNISWEFWCPHDCTEEDSYRAVFYPEQGKITLCSKCYAKIKKVKE